MEFGKRIRRLRKERGMTQKQLAEALFITSQAVSKWENGFSCPDINMLPQIAAALGVKISDLFE